MMVRRQKLAALMTAVVSLSIPAIQARAGQLEDLQRQVTDLQNRLKDLERQQQHETQERQAKQQQLEKEQAEVKEQASSGFFAKGSFPGSYKIPGTNTSLRLGGYAKLDIIHDLNAPQGDFVSFPSIPLAGTVAARRQGDTRLDARQSRFNIETRTPTAYGTAKTLIEGDLEGVGGNEFASNSTTFRLRHAYGGLGPLLAGQTWSNFMYVESLP